MYKDMQRCDTYQIEKSGFSHGGKSGRGKIIRKMYQEISTILVMFYFLR